MYRNGFAHIILLLIIAVPIVFFLGSNFPKSSPIPSLPTSQKDYTRQDIKTIKGTFDPGYTKEILNDNTADLKDIGFNTIYIYVNHEYQNKVMKITSPFGRGDASDKAEEEYKSLIKLAKEKGFAVFLAIQFGGGQNKPLGVPQDQFLSDTKARAIYWAKIAEELKVEFFAPASEIDFHIDKEYYSSGSRGKVVEIVNKLHGDMLPDLRENFKGKLVYQHASYNQSNVLATGYDLIGIDFGPAGRTLEQMRVDVKSWFKTTSQTAQNSKTDWFVSEFGVLYKKKIPGERDPIGTLNNDLGQSYDNLQDEYFQVVFEEYLNFEGQKPKGMGILSYMHPIYAIKGRPAQEVVKRFFGSI